MALVLQSNQIATKHLGDMYGTAGNIPWHIMFDFERNKYKVRDVNLTEKAFSDLLSFTRSSVAEYVDENGDYVQAEKNTPRLSYDQKLNIGGLILENSRSNYYFPSDTPLTKTISLPATPREFIVQVEGTGTLSLVGNITAITTTQGNATLTAKQGQFVVFKLNDPKVVTPVQFNIAGALTFCQCEAATKGHYASSRIHSIAAQGNREADAADGTPELIGSIGKVGAIAISVVLPENLVPATTSVAETWLSGILRLSDGSNDISIGGSFTSRSLRIRKFMNNEEYVFAASQTKRINTIAMTWGGGTMRAALNGVYLGETAINPNFLPTQLVLGGFDSWVTAPAGGIVKRMALFNSKMSAKEIAKVSESYL